MIDPALLQRRFFDKLSSGLSLAPSFEYLPEVYFYVKDRRSRFVKVNAPLWKMRGFDGEADMLGPDRPRHSPAAPRRAVHRRGPPGDAQPPAAAQPDLARARQRRRIEMVHLQQDAAVRHPGPGDRAGRRDARPGESRVDDPALPGNGRRAHLCAAALQRADRRGPTGRGSPACRSASSTAASSGCTT